MLPGAAAGAAPWVGALNGCSAPGVPRPAAQAAPRIPGADVSAATGVECRARLPGRHLGKTALYPTTETTYRTPRLLPTSSKVESHLRNKKSISADARDEGQGSCMRARNATKEQHLLALGGSLPLGRRLLSVLKTLASGIAGVHCHARCRGIKRAGRIPTIKHYR